MKIKRTTRFKNKGVVLLLAMVFLLLLAILSATAMQTGILEFRMVGNEQFQEEAFQAAQAIVSAISSNGDNFPEASEVGATICKVGDSSPACHETVYITLDSGLETVPPGVEVAYRVERVGPLYLPELPVRLAQTSVSSSLAYNAAVFETQVRIDGTGVNLGVAELAQGVALLVANSTGSQAE